MSSRPVSSPISTSAPATTRSSSSISRTWSCSIHLRRSSSPDAASGELHGHAAPGSGGLERGESRSQRSQPVLPGARGLPLAPDRGGEGPDRPGVEVLLLERHDLLAAFRAQDDLADGAL